MAPIPVIFLDWATLSCPTTAQFALTGHLMLFFNNSGEPISPGPRFTQSFNKKLPRGVWQCSVQTKPPPRRSLHASQGHKTELIYGSVICQEGGHSQEPRAQRQHLAVRRVTSCPCSFGTFGAETRAVPGQQGCWSPSDKCQSWISNSLGAQAPDAPLPPLGAQALDAPLPPTAGASSH